ncbi:MAG: xanthine dehydrogenase family protein molybdopterin-binding subunit [Thermaerobacter sp.]|nr:xanthine dehydrogenase family protein molybdopterin-binding subunit [Thermaerobacter sp.]
MPSVKNRGGIGDDLLRLEDDRLLKGQGRFVGDMRVPHVLELAVLRSLHAHAEIVSIEDRGASALPGVVHVVTGAQLQEEAPGLFALGQPPLVAGETLYVGQGVAAALAEDRYVAEDALEKLFVRYRRLPVLSDVERIVEESGEAAVTLGDSVIGFGEVEPLFAAADIVLEERLAIGRATAQPLEGRAILAMPEGEGLLVYAATQGPHGLRQGLAKALSLAPELVRVVAQDVGGGFGVKNGVYPDDILVAYLALKLQRPVRFQEDRREHFLSTVHSRAQVHRIRVAARRDGTLLAVDDDILLDAGAYQARVGYGRTTAVTIPGPYHLSAYRCRIRDVHTHKVPVGPYRGAGRPEGNFVMERMLDALSRRLGIDRAEIRRRNLIEPHEMPYDTRIPDRNGNGVIVYDSGDYPLALETALKAADIETWRERQKAPLPDGRRIGVGIAMFTEDTGVAPFEMGVVDLLEDGRIRIASGSPAQGQGHETTFTQIACSALSQTPGQIVYADTDTALVPAGIGTFGSRATVMAGSAVHLACKKLEDMVLTEAGAILGEAKERLSLSPGRVDAPQGGLQLRDLAASIEAKGEHLRAEAVFRPEQPTYADGCHIAMVAVDPLTGSVEILKYIIVDDCGNVISPRLVDGQIQGGLAFGVAAALLEELVYDNQGQLLTGSFMDYPLPTALDVPAAEIHHLCSPSPRNPLGVKGVGEGGTVPALAAIAGAVEDALLPIGGGMARQLPLTPERVVRLASANERQ